MNKKLWIMVIVVLHCVPGCGEKMSSARIGQPAPLFTLLDETEAPRSLLQLRGQKVVLYFYPKDNTPGCTKQACSIRDGYAQLQQAGIHIWGISYDAPQSHRKFKEKYHLPFALLSDNTKEVSKLYGVNGWFFPSRVSFLINEQGNIVAIMRDVDVSHHAQQILSAFAG